MRLFEERPKKKNINMNFFSIAKSFILSTLEVSGSTDFQKNVLDFYFLKKETISYKQHGYGQFLLREETFDMKDFWKKEN